MVLTAGDALSDLVDREGLGRVVPSEDVGALAAALEALGKDAEARAGCRARIEEVRPRFTWAVAAAPLVEFCRQPRRAPDLVGKLGPAQLRLPGHDDDWRPSRARRAVRMFRNSLRDDGALVTGRRIVGKLAKKTLRRG
jgi:hypothetical protein